MTATIATSLGWIRDVLGFCHQVLWPLLLFAVRLWLATIFFEHGVDGLTGTPPSTLSFALMPYVEIACAALLVAGLLTRIAAIPISLFSLFIYFGDLGIVGHVLCALLALGLVVYGPGPIALDPIVGRGLTHAPLPLARWPERIYRALESLLDPVFKLVLRLGMGGIFWMTGESLVNASGTPWVDYGPALPQGSLVPFTGNVSLMTVQLTAAIFLAVGFMTRVAALILTVITLAISLGIQMSPEYILWALVLGTLTLTGPGPISLDAPIDGWLARHIPAYTGQPAFSLEGTPRVVIVGAGFAGLAAATALAKTRALVTVIDRHNYHLFQPLLYQVATAALSPADIAMPIRSVLRKQFNAHVLFGKVTDVDTQNQRVMIGTNPIAYDYLVLATGARHAYFGNDHWESMAPGLKKIDDATDVRRRLLLAFERAEGVADPVERDRLMTFIIIGGGPTGVELAGAIAELARFGLEREFNHINPAQARVILVQAASKILPMFPDDLIRAARRDLEVMGVEVRCDSRVTNIDAMGVTINQNERINAGTVLWAAGVQASRAFRWLGCEADRAGRVKVEPDLSVPGHANIFVVGDTASMTTSDGKPVPGLAPAAKQSGEHAAAVIHARINEQREPGPFRYRHLGSLATIGRESAIADFGWLKLSGNVAWWLWGVAHVLFLVGGRNRLAVIINWAWAYVTFHHATRLITGTVDEPLEPEAMAQAAE